MNYCCSCKSQCLASNCFSLPLDHGINKSHKKQINSAATDKWLSEFSYPIETWYSFWENGPINHRGWRTSAISVPSWGDSEGDYCLLYWLRLQRRIASINHCFLFGGFWRKIAHLIYQGLQNIKNNGLKYQRFIF